MKGLGASGAIAGLAGCGGGGDGGDGGGGDGGDGGGGDGGDGGRDMGERVPPIIMQYWSGVGSVTATYESMIPTIQNNWSELGLSTEPLAQSYPSVISGYQEGTYDRHFSFFVHSPNPLRIDPDEMLVRFGIHRAGNTGVDNPSNFANCEYTDLAFNQRVEADPERRREMVAEAAAIRQSEFYAMPVVRRGSYGIYDSEKVDIGGVGAYGIAYNNEHIPRKSTPKSGDSFAYSANPVAIRTKNYYTYTATPAISLWARVVNQPLTSFSENYEERNVIADEISVENGGLDIRVSLVENAEFHNGDPVTAEDVKFTFDLIQNNPGAYPLAPPKNYDEIVIEDDYEVLFTGDTPDPTLLTRAFPAWGILHAQSWRDAGAPDNPGESFPDEIIGSGPFQVTNFQADQYMRLEPHTGHPLYGEDGWTPEHNVDVLVYDDQEAEVQAFLNRDLHIAPNKNVSVLERTADQDWVGQEGTLNWGFNGMYIEMAAGPTQFREFRQALGMSIDREHINQLVFNGRSAPSMLPDSWQGEYPFLNPEETRTHYTDDPTGDLEGARALLEENGWGWDSDGNLHYPADYDTSPVWPEGERPQPDDFPCMGEFDGTILYEKPDGEPFRHQS